jgi:hypothetical protein
MYRLRIVPAVLFAFSLAFGSHAAAQEPGDPARFLAETRKGIHAYMASVQARTMELGRKVEVLGQLTESAAREPALGEPVTNVIAIVSQLIATPPFGMPADQLRARLFVEISKLEEDILRQAESFQSESNAAEMLARSLDQIQRSFHTAAVSGGEASLATRRRALKGGS